MTVRLLSSHTVTRYRTKVQNQMQSKNVINREQCLTVSLTK